MERYSKKLTFAQQAILNQITRKQAVVCAEKFQDNIVHTDHLDYHDYNDYCDYTDCHGDYYDYEYNDAADRAADNPVATNTKTGKTNIFQRIFSKFGRYR